MTGLIILTFIPLVVAAGFLIRVRSEQKARLAAEHKLIELRRQAHRASPEWYAVLAHELRSPVSAILGYEELLEDGTFGEIPPKAVDAARRIRTAALQLTALLDGIESGHTRGADSPPQDLGAMEISGEAIAALSVDAQGRDTTIVLIPTDVRLTTRTDAARRALLLLLGAAIKASPGATLTVTAEEAPQPRFTIRGSRLDPERDSGEPGRPLTGAAFRLHLARAAARPAQGIVEVDADGTTRLVLPRLMD